MPETHVEELTFTPDEEPNMLGSDKGYGYFPVLLGQTILAGKYKLVRKLGYGSNSTVWLAKDSNRFVALKILTAVATMAVDRGLSSELQLSKLIGTLSDQHPGRRHVARTIDDFLVESHHGIHACLVLKPSGTNIEDYYMSSRGRGLPIPITKLIVKQTLLGLDYLHRVVGIVHTDVKPANLLVSIEQSTDTISDYLRKVPAEEYPIRHDPEVSQDPIHTIVSQPLPNFGLDPAGSNLELKLADFGHAIRIGAKATHGPPARIRAPEVVLGYQWSTPIDIWSLGCLVFECLDGSNIFDPRQYGSHSAEQSLLLQMVERTGEQFDRSFLESCSRRDLFFTPEGDLRIRRHPMPHIIENSFVNYPFYGKVEAGKAADFIRRCLRLNPADRPTAAQLLEDEWLQGV